MPGEFLSGPNGAFIHLNYGRMRGKRVQCKFCKSSYRKDEGKLCDFPVEHGKTCDAEICRGCAVTLGGQRTRFGDSEFTRADSVDLCPIHRNQATFVNGKLEIKGADTK